MGITTQFSPTSQTCLDENIPVKRRPTSVVAANDVLNTAFYEPDQEAECTDSEQNEISCELTFNNNKHGAPIMNRANSLREDSSMSFNERNELKKLDEMIDRHPFLLGYLAPILIQLGILLLLIFMFSTFGFSHIFEYLVVKLCRVIFNFL